MCYNEPGCASDPASWTLPTASCGPAFPLPKLAVFARFIVRPVHNGPSGSPLLL